MGREGTDQFAAQLERGQKWVTRACLAVARRPTVYVM